MARLRKTQLAVVATLFAITAVTVIATACYVWSAPRKTGPDLSGTWTGRPGWGTVVLEPRADGGFAGTYSDTYGRHTGRLELSWNAWRGRYDGVWREGTYRFGTLTLEPRPDGTFEGEYSADPGCELNPGSPKSQAFRWTRGAAVEPTPGPNPLRWLTPRSLPPPSTASSRR